MDIPAWKLDSPLAVLEEHGLKPNVVTNLEKGIGGLYVRDILRLTRAELLSVRQVGRIAAGRTLDALERFLGVRIPREDRANA